MICYWLKFEDGTESYCEGQSAADAKSIAEKLTGKTVAGGDDFKYRADENPNIQRLPYSRGRDIIWKFEHPVYGQSPGFCHGGKECRGRSACPQNYACSN